MNLSFLRSTNWRWLAPSLFVLSLGMLIYGLTEPYVMMNLWPPLQQTQALVILCIAVVMYGLFVVIGRRYGHGLLWGGGLALGAGILVFAFGWQAVGAALLTLLSGFCMGQLCLTLAGCSRLSLLEVCVVGIGCTILLLTAVGVAQIDLPTFYIILLIVPPALVFLIPTLRQQGLQHWPQAQTEQTENTFTYTRFILGTLILFIALYETAASTLPEVSWDGLVMHLLVPTQILLHGHWAFDQTLYAFAPWPIGTDYLFGMGMLAGGELGAKCFNLLLFFLLMVQFYDLMRKRIGHDLALTGVALFMAIPLTFVVTTALYVENMLAVLTLAGLRLLDASEEADPKTTLVGLAVIMGALAAVKMHGLFLDAFFMLALVVMPFWKKVPKRAWSVVAIVAVLAVGLGMLTYLYAWVKTGNPIFMFKNSFFRSPYWDTTDWLDKRWMNKLSWQLLYNMTFSSQNFVEALPGTIGFAFVAFLLPGVATVLMAPKNYQRGLIIVTMGFLAFMLSQTQYIRYLYTIMPPLLMISMMGFGTLQQYRFGRMPLKALAIILVLFGCYKFPAGDWVLRVMDFRQIGGAPSARMQEVAMAAPERLMNDAINSTGMPEPRVLYGTLPFGGNLRGVPLYTDWYNYTLHKALDTATSDAQIETIISGAKADFLITNDVSEEPIYQKLSAYAHAHLKPYALLGHLTLYRLRS